MLRRASFGREPQKWPHPRCHPIQLLDVGGTLKCDISGWGEAFIIYSIIYVLYRVIYIYLFRMYLFLLIHPKITAVRLEMVEIGMFLLPFFACAMSAGFEANGTG